MERFASPLNCSMELGITYCSRFLEDPFFGAIHNALNYRCIVYCTANPEYDSEDTRKAILHALASSKNTTTPFMAVLVLPVFEDKPWRSASIRSHPNIETLIQIPSGHMRLVPTHKQSEGNADTLTPAK
jgi:hypothetical protein